jgi:hypothetical protein
MVKGSSLPNLSKKTTRFLVIAAVWFLFWYISTHIVASLDRISATYWSAGGLLGFPLMAGLFLVLDHWALHIEWIQGNLGKYVSLTALLGILLYYPITLFVFLLLDLMFFD